MSRCTCVICFYVKTEYLKKCHGTLKEPVTTLYVVWLNDLKNWQAQHFFHYKYLTHFTPMFYLYSPENMRKSDVFRGYRNGTLG